MIGNALGSVDHTVYVTIRRIAAVWCAAGVLYTLHGAPLIFRAAFARINMY